MGARSKLNEAYIGGAIVIGIIAFLTTGSLFVGVFVCSILIGMSTAVGNIRVASDATHRNQIRSHRSKRS